MVYKTPSFLKKAFPDMVWSLPESEKKVYLTFDDGPVPHYTDYVLDVLDKYGIKATFFCVGDNVRKYPDVFQKVQDEGHAIGSHTYHHVSGWSMSLTEYLNEARIGSAEISSGLFRPPHGKISPRQANVLSRHFTLVMWDVLSGDFIPSLTARECANNVIGNVQPGSVIVFHDSEKAFPRMEKALPIVIENLLSRGYSFDSLSHLSQHNRNTARKTA